jgi:hypothetical protein
MVSCVVPMDTHLRPVYGSRGTIPYHYRRVAGPGQIERRCNCGLLERIVERNREFDSCGFWFHLLRLWFGK